MQGSGLIPALKNKEEEKEEVEEGREGLGREWVSTAWFLHGYLFLTCW